MDSNKVLILGLTWPEPRATAAGTRMMQLIHWFLEKEFEITFASTAAFTDYSESLTTYGIDQQAIKLNHHSFDEFAKRLKSFYCGFRPLYYGGTIWLEDSGKFTRCAPDFGY